MRLPEMLLHLSCCPAGGSGFKSDPALMDFGQSSPEDEDLYSTRSWDTSVGETSFLHCHLIQINKHLVSFMISLSWGVNRPFRKQAEIESLYINISILFSSAHIIYSSTEKVQIHLHCISNVLNSSKQNCLCIKDRKLEQPTTFNKSLIHRWQIVKFSLHMCHSTITGFHLNECMVLLFIIQPIVLVSSNSAHMLVMVTRWSVPFCCINIFVHLFRNKNKSIFFTVSCCFLSNTKLCHAHRLLIYQTHTFTGETFVT